MSPQSREGDVTSPEEWELLLAQIANDRIRSAFSIWRNNPEAKRAIKQLLDFGRRMNDESLGADRPTREDFEALVDRLIDRPEGQFLLENHPTLAANNLGVIRGAIDGVVGGKPVEYRPVREG